jgi:hypothetical protein
MSSLRRIVMDVKCPNVRVELVGSDGNAFAILGKVRQAMRRAKVPEAVVKEYMDEATNGDYDHLLQTTMKYVEVD